MTCQSFDDPEYAAYLRWRENCDLPEFEERDDAGVREADDRDND